MVVNEVIGDGDDGVMLLHVHDGDGLRCFHVVAHVALVVVAVAG